ncbi:hypothetical protein AGABI1DRAFT_107947 [Agaricus bisporus var. burnettii JB137-S8]|uniref:Uncharacterized protein n=1 Tax=Agaricus bisporus var. burnettii (strain JB137-S8 / ATCC MYA-4627 / FGSC 10392) TaxID=597362 RepID=K5WQZ7_AGABU|nr:uncharacterized protein AGABI1DRAFT_107947 [Agaricus bisporus var. burnettii JB137-S8]EKM77786.1 hypothetical protein AGABI1DRAFT_107947 [Agaricus bisporus var. burnettii JB137-S8]
MTSTPGSHVRLVRLRFVPVAKHGEIKAETKHEHALKMGKFRGVSERVWRLGFMLVPVWRHYRIEESKMGFNRRSPNPNRNGSPKLRSGENYLPPAVGNTSQFDMVIFFPMIRVPSEILTLCLPFIGPGREVIVKIDGWTDIQEDHIGLVLIESRNQLIKTTDLILKIRNSFRRGQCNELGGALGLRLIQPARMHKVVATARTIHES